MIFNTNIQPTYIQYITFIPRGSLIHSVVLMIMQYHFISLVENSLLQYHGSLTVSWVCISWLLNLHTSSRYLSIVSFSNCSILNSPVTLKCRFHCTIAYIHSSKRYHNIVSVLVDSCSIIIQEMQSENVLPIHLLYHGAN